jgi:uncharacterized protein YigE (DUF2233 family)
VAALLALAAVLLLGACGGSSEAAREPEAACNPVLFEDSPLTHCVADPAKHRVRMVLDGPDGEPARSLTVLAGTLPDPAVVAFAMNGGMYDTEGKPIGYYVENGDRRHTLNRNPGAGNFHLLPNGVFYGTGGEWHVRATENFAESVTRRPEFATQSGPMLVIDGELHPGIAEDGTSLKIRNAVGVDATGRAHFVISEAPLSFGKLARYFRDRLETPNALFLDGSVSVLWDPAHDRLDEGVPLGPLIVVEKRATGREERLGP